MCDHGLARLLGWGSSSVIIATVGARTTSAMHTYLTASNA